MIFLKSPHSAITQSDTNRNLGFERKVYGHVPQENFKAVDVENVEISGNCVLDA